MGISYDAYLAYGIDLGEYDHEIDWDDIEQLLKPYGLRLVYRGNEYSHEGWVICAKGKVYNAFYFTKKIDPNDLMTGGGFNFELFLKENPTIAAALGLKPDQEPAWLLFNSVR